MLPGVKAPFISVVGVSCCSSSDCGRLITLFNVETLCKHVLSCHSFCTGEETTEGKHLPWLSSLRLFHASYASPVWIISQQLKHTGLRCSQMLMPELTRWVNESNKLGRKSNWQKLKTILHLVVLVVLESRCRKWMLSNLIKWTERSNFAVRFNFFMYWELEALI